MTNVTIPQSVLQRLAHLTEDGEAYVPELYPRRHGYVPFESRFDFLSPTVLYPVDGTENRYLVAMYSTKAQWTLIGLDYLAHQFCDDPGCEEVQRRLAEQQAGVPPGGMLYARVQVDPGVDWLPNPLPYVIHISDAEHFTGAVSPAAEVDLF